MGGNVGLRAALIDLGLIAFVREHRLAAADEDGLWTPLTGGVSSDIWRVETSRGIVCVKRALAQLRVAADWSAPVERNAFEWAYISLADAVASGSVPRPLAHDPERGLFAMAWLAPEEHRLWKAELFAGRVDPGFAALVGDLIGRIHHATACDLSIPSRFPTDASFEALRIEPYLRATAARNPDLADRILAIARTTAETKYVLVHGDISPKNIFVGPQGPVLVDAEVAWFGDPAFDVAFCLTHLVIKARVLPAARDALRAAFEALRAAYSARVTWEAVETLEARAAALLPALALARVDGKSPVEYLDAAQQAGLRVAARAALGSGTRNLSEARALLIA